MTYRSLANHLQIWKKKYIHIHMPTNVLCIIPDWFASDLWVNCGDLSDSQVIHDWLMVICEWFANDSWVICNDWWVNHMWFTNDLQWFMNNLQVIHSNLLAIHKLCKSFMSNSSWFMWFVNDSYAIHDWSASDSWMNL